MLMDWIQWLRWAHVLGACILIGTGAGIAFFMLMAHRTRNSAVIAHVAETVVIADFLFTATAVIVQPITGILLAEFPDKANVMKEHGYYCFGPLFSR